MIHFHVRLFCSSCTSNICNTQSRKEQVEDCEVVRINCTRANFHYREHYRFVFRQMLWRSITAKIVDFEQQRIGPNQLLAICKAFKERGLLAAAILKALSLQELLLAYGRWFRWGTCFPILLSLAVSGRRRFLKPPESILRRAWRST